VDSRAPARARARCIEATIEDVDDKVVDRLAKRLSYVGGDFSDAGLFERVRDALGDAQTPVFYLEIPPSLFATVVEGLAKAELVKTGSRIAVEKPVRP